MLANSVLGHPFCAPSKRYLPAKKGGVSAGWNWIRTRDLTTHPISLYHHNLKF